MYALTRDIIYNILIQLYSDKFHDIALGSMPLLVMLLELLLVHKNM